MFLSGAATNWSRRDDAFCTLYHLLVSSFCFFSISTRHLIKHTSFLLSRWSHLLLHTRFHQKIRERNICVHFDWSRRKTEVWTHEENSRTQHRKVSLFYLCTVIISLIRYTIYYSFNMLLFCGLLTQFIQPLVWLLWASNWNTRRIAKN